MDYRQLIIDSINIDGIDKQDLLTLVTAPKDSAMGDLCIPCFKLAKEMKKSPTVIADEIAKSVDKGDMIEQVTAVAGFVNFKFDNVKFAKQVLADVLANGDGYGKSNEGNGKTICIDYSSVNIAKPFHMGHLLNTALGGAIYRIYTALGYNVVGAMNTALAYDSNAPYGYMVMNGVVLGTPEVHKGAQTYLAIDGEGNCELRSMSTPLNGSEVTAISANFGWLVKDGELQVKTVEREENASRSMIGIKADGTLVFCQVDGRNAPFSSGLSNYEMGEMMLALGCVNAVNCDGGGSSTFVSKREGETTSTMRSVPSDGSERATINSVILVSKAKATGEFDHAVLSSAYNYYAPGTSAEIQAQGVDAAGSPAEIPTTGITWALSDASFGNIEDGVFVSNGTKGDVTVQMLYNSEIVGEKLIHVVDPDVFVLALDETVLPYGKSMVIDFACTYGVDNWAVCVDGAYTFTLSDASAAVLDGNTFIAPTDETVSSVDVTATYIPDTSRTDTLKITFGKGSEVIYDFEDGSKAGFAGFTEAKKWSQENGVENTLVGSTPTYGPGGSVNFSDVVDSETFVASEENGGKVKRGEHALAWTLDNTGAYFNTWTYNYLFNTGETVVLRDVANGKNATALGMWLYIPEGAAGLAFQSQFYTKTISAETGEELFRCVQDHFMFTTASGVRKNLNSCTEADIPESRWVYASIDITKYDYLCTPVATDESNVRSPSFIRTYVKPKTPAVHTFYIDDITLDYSSAVEDRVLPTIDNVSYAISDESVALEEGAVIGSGTMAFSAAVADNVKLDYTTGKIYVDGNALDNVTAAGGYLASESVMLTAGVHTIAFEIQDTNGNLAKVTRTVTVAGDSVITLSGHNDSGATPECGSVYYVDICAADLTVVNKITAELKLQTANTWEPQGIAVADGFKATYSLNEPEQILTITIERNGEEIDASGTPFASLPVRLWSWDTVNCITGEAVASEKLLEEGGMRPIVAVDCRVLTGTAEFIDGAYNGFVGAFGGAVSVETMINDDVNPWHYHDAELTILNKDASCTTDGYANRTYCQTCKSIMDWGTVISAAGHTFNLDGKCTACGKEVVLDGLCEIGGGWYYYIDGKAVSGWQMIGTDWYYFDPATKIGAEGDVKIGLVTFNFEHGKLTAGVWVKTLFGTRYYYGPGFYNDRGSWRNIDGKDYYFEKGYRLEGGYELVFENQINRNWYYFNADGSCDKSKKLPDGFYTDRNGLAYSKDGQAPGGLQCIDGKYYYFNDLGYAQKNGTYASRLFKDDYAAYTGLLEKDGVLYYYVNGRTATCGLFELDGDYYYAYWGGVVKTDGRYYVEASYCDLPVGNYTFGADGKMLHGVVEKDGISYLYVNGSTASNGLYKIDGDYYCSYWGGVLRTDGRYYVDKTYCDLPVGNYTFGADGKMLNGIVDKDGTKYLYINGATATYGLYKIDGDYYYSYWGGVLRTDGRYYVDTTFCDLPIGNYTFGADGKMLNGFETIDGTIYYYVNGNTPRPGIIEVNGDYYFVNWGGVIVTNQRFYVFEGNGYTIEMNYTFDATGKIVG